MSEQRTSAVSRTQIVVDALDQVVEIGSVFEDEGADIVAAFVQRLSKHDVDLVLGVVRPLLDALERVGAVGDQLDGQTSHDPFDRHQPGFGCAGNHLVSSPLDEPVENARRMAARQARIHRSADRVFDRLQSFADAGRAL